VGTALIASTAAAVIGAGTAQAAEATPVSTPILLGTLHLTKTDNSGTTTEADLTCFKGINVFHQVYVGGNGTVTDPVTACQELDAVNGDLSRMDAHPTWLTSALYAPVMAMASGTWRASDVTFCHGYTNGGELTKFLGDVFAF
jgi:hypothetical protein